MKNTIFRRRFALGLLNALILLGLAFAFTSSAQAQASLGTPAWAWMGGSNLTDASGVYGTEYQFAASSVPGSRSGAVSWSDPSGNLWLFGGYGAVEVQGNLMRGYRNDLWELNTQWAAQNHLPNLATLVFAADSVVTNNSVTLTVTLSAAAPAGGAAVSLSSNNTALSVSAIVTVPAGQNSVTVTLQGGSVMSFRPFLAPVFVTVTGVYNGVQTAQMWVVPYLLTPMIESSGYNGSVAQLVTVRAALVLTGSYMGWPDLTGSITLTSAFGGYTSAPATLTGEPMASFGSITIPAWVLPAGFSALYATYTPDAQGAMFYTGAKGFAEGIANAVAPTVTVTPSSTSITVLQPLTVTVSANAGAGSPTSTGSIQAR